MAESIRSGETDRRHRKPVMPARITAIVGSYNGERPIDRAVSSLLARTIRDIDVIGVDDGSTDSTVDVVRVDRVT